MSDFGAAITLIKKDQNPLTDGDRSIVKSKLLKIQTKGGFSDVLGEDFLFEVHEASNCNTELFLVFSRYWYGEGDDEENFEFAKDNDLSQVEEIADQLKPGLQNIFEIHPDFENW